MYTVNIRHNFETAHRLSHPQAPTKCQSIHGHSWWVDVDICGEALDERGMIVEFGAFKLAWRSFLDDHVDHHLALKEGDPVAAAIRSVLPESRVLELPFEPTTEHMARWLYERASEVLNDGLNPDDRLWIGKVHVQETRVNAASYAPPRPLTSP